MKNVKLFLAALFAVAIAAPAFAQSQDPHANEKWKDGKVTVSADAIERAAVKAKRERQASECPKCHKAYTIDEKYHGVKHTCKAKKDAKKACACCACGEEVNAGQHCKATDYTTLCSGTPEQKGKTASCKAQEVCPTCHKAYTVDEKHHGVKHQCETSFRANGGEPETGWYFIEVDTPESSSPNGGEPETKFFCVRASAAPTLNGGEPETDFLCEIDPDALHRAEELLQADRDAHNGKAVHTLEYYYEQAAGKAPLSQTKKTPKAKKVKTEFCIYCGEAILKQDQHCSAQQYASCTVSCPECGQNLRNPKNVSSDGEHRCKFKARIQTVPAKNPDKK